MQTEVSIADADAVLFVVDARAGLTPLDNEIGNWLRTADVPVIVVANKAEGRSGVAESFLRPAGIARFGKHRVDVLTEGDFVDKGERVVIVRTEGNRVFVRKEEG